MDRIKEIIYSQHLMSISKYEIQGRCDMNLFHNFQYSDVFIFVENLAVGKPAYQSSTWHDVYDTAHASR